MIAMRKNSSTFSTKPDLLLNLQKRGSDPTTQHNISDLDDTKMVQTKNGAPIGSVEIMISRTEARSSEKSDDECQCPATAIEPESALFINSIQKNGSPIQKPKTVIID